MFFFMLCRYSVEVEAITLARLKKYLHLTKDFSEIMKGNKQNEKKE